MILQVQPGDRFDAPADGAFDLQCASSFSPAELDQSDTLMVLDYQGPAGQTNQIAGSNTGSDVIFTIPAGTFTPGEWALSPWVQVAGEVRRFPIPLVMNVVGTFQVRAENC